ncbi:MAG TPA: hypothetical protein VFC59_05365 [Cryobacterium sp.]|nr:hypothetical protein [Cryobacterium sp.]
MVTSGWSRNVAWTRGALLWTLGLAIMAGFQLWRSAWVDGILFSLLVGMLVIDTLTGGRIRLLRLPVAAPRWLVLAGTAALGVVLVLSPRHGWVDLLMTGVIGVAVLLLIWAPGPARTWQPAAAVRRSALAWSVLAVGLSLWEALAFILGAGSEAARWEFPTVSVLLDPVVESTLGRAVFVGLWLLGGLALLRVRRRS